MCSALSSARARKHGRGVSIDSLLASKARCGPPPRSMKAEPIAVFSADHQTMDQTPKRKAGGGSTLNWDSPWRVGPEANRHTDLSLAICRRHLV